MKWASPFLALAVLAWLTISGGVAQSAAQAPGTWQNVTPAGVNLSTGGCGNFGTQTVVVDPARPSDLYAEFNCQGIWKSTDFGQSWAGPINTGAGGAAAGDCAGGIAIAPGPILYEACIRGAGNGFQRSLDGGASWTKFTIGPAGNRQDVYPPVVDPYDPQHLVVNAHELNAIYQSVDGGQTWTSVPFANGMQEPGGTGFLFFIDTGGAASTRTNWLWLAQGTGGKVGTWRTTDGANWRRVDTNEHAHGSSQIYQPDSSGTVYMAGTYSAEGWGILRSSDYGMTWQRVGNSAAENIVFGTPNNVYAGYGWACAQCGIDPSLQVAPQPGRTGWVQVRRPPDMTEGFATAATTFDGANYVILSANWTGGLFRYVEPSGGAPAPTPTSTPTVGAPTSTSVPSTPVVTSTPTPPASGPPPSSIAGLHVAGNQILNASNQPVRLRGVDHAGTEYMCTGSNLVFDGPTDQASIDALKAWSINVVRLPINEDCWLGINGVPKAPNTAQTYQASIVDYIDRLNSNGIAVVFDLQWAESDAVVPSYALQQMPDADHAIAFWQSAANVFKGNGSVIFDLFNEPWPNSNADDTLAWTCLRDGRAACPAMTNSKGQAYTAVGMQELTNVIRATGATNIIQSPGVQFTNGLSQWLTFKPNDPQNNVIADWHSYADQICNNQTCWDANVRPVAQSVPLVASEIGERDCSHQPFIDPLMTWLDGEEAGYLGWAWNTYDCSSFPSLISNYDGTPTGFGVGLRNHLLAAAGVPTPTPAAIPMFNNAAFPYGINVGSTTSYTASDGTTYLPDQNAADGSMTVKAGAGSGYRMDPYTTSAAISGPDPVLYQKGRTGPSALWTINVPNGTYTVTLGAAPTAAYTNPPTAGEYSTGEFGQDQVLQGQKNGTCVWSYYSDGNVSPYSNTACPQNAQAQPTIGSPNTVSYSVQVFNQQLSIQVGASFGSGRETIVDSILIEQAGGAPQPTPTAVAGTPTPTPLVTDTPTPTLAPTVAASPSPTPSSTPTVTAEPTHPPSPTSTSTPTPTVTITPTRTATPTRTPIPCSVTVTIAGTPGPVLPCLGL